MKIKQRYVKSILSLCLFLTAYANVLADDASDDWITLFNGKDLSGWEQKGGKALYEVIDQTIVGTTVAKTPNSFLATTRTFGDFILEFEFKVDPIINSGVQFRSHSIKSYKNGRVHGYQFEMDPSDRAWTAGIFDEGRRGWLYPLKLNPEVQEKLQGDHWYSARVECLGNDVKTYLNGNPVAHLVDKPSIPQDGFIALQVHSVSHDKVGKTVHWRNIQLTEKVDKYRWKGKKQIFTKKLINIK